jgi:uncharacterized alkaline shock family protein YloU
MNNEENPLGSINISPRVIATIAYQAAMQSYGVVGLASKNIIDEVSNVLVKDPTHGIEVSYKDDTIDIDIYIVIEYGTRIKSVAASVANVVRYHTERTLGLPVNEINVHVQGLRISEHE